MPTSLIPIIARTNTIDEWRIQTNKSASDLNDLGFYTYDKNQGTLLLSNTSLLSITANGTPLQVANNVLFQSSLTLGNTLFLGVQSSATGNIIAGGTVSVRGPGSALSVSNNSYVGVDLQVVSNIYANNYTANGSLTVANNVTVSTGILRLNGTGNVAYVNSGSISANTLYVTDTNSTNVKTANLTAAFARIDVLDDLAFARIGILENTTGNSYYLSSNSHTSNSIATRYITANISGNIVNFSSNVSSINTATILTGNVVSLTSNLSGINVATINTSTTLVGNVVSLTSNLSAINVATVNTSTTLVGNVVSLTSNTSSINVATVNTASINVLSSYNLTSTHRITANNIITNNVEVSTINVAHVNISSNLWIASGSVSRIYAPTEEHESLTVDGKTTLETALVTNNLTVQGTFTQLGDIEYETNEIIFNKRTPTNADVIIRNERPVGNDAIIQWSESDDQWVLSKGNTYTQLFGILDTSFLDSSVLNVSSSNVATPLAVNIAHTTAQTVGRYANSSYIHANASFNWANVVSTTANANTARLTTDVTIAGNYANNAYMTANSAQVYANAAFRTQNTTGVYANSAFDVANTALIAGGTISGGYANAAFARANTANTTSISASSYANGAFAAANTAATAAALAQSSGVSAGLYANAAYEAANSAVDTWVRNAANSASSYANSAFANANNAIYKTGQTSQTLSGSLEVTGNVNTSDIKFTPGTTLLQGSKVVINSNQNQNQGPSLSATIEVDRGISPNAIFRYNETIDRWEYTHALSDPADFTTLGFISERANNITGGAANRIPVQTSANVTSFIDAPVTANYFLKWTGSAFTWADVPTADLSNLNATNLTSGILPLSRVTKLNNIAGSTPNDGTKRVYSMHIDGDAAYATTAGSATSATSATTAGSTTNVTAGGSVTTGTINQGTTTALTNYGGTDFYNRVRIRNSTQATTTQDNSNSPASGAALYVEGGIYCEKDIVCDILRGTATAAYYSADVAEKYLPDVEYPTGTILMVGGKKEVTAATKEKSYVIIGVVSENPSLIMNSQLEGGVIVGLKGRLPVRVIGKCKKGDLLEMSDIPGVGIVSDGNKLPLRLICLENKKTEEEGTVEVAIM
jgi:hypothetical protein